MGSRDNGDRSPCGRAALYLANGRLYNGVADIEAFDVTATGLSLPR